MTQTQTSRWLYSRLRGMRLTRLRTLSAVVFSFLEVARLGIAAIHVLRATFATFVMETGADLLPGPCLWSVGQSDERQA